MRSRNRKTPSQEDRIAPLTARIVELEDRIRILEAKMREFTAQSRRAAAATGAAEAEGPKPRAARTRPRPRCPGCTLELPKGRRGDSCVWCGFMFSAVGARAFR